MSNLFGGRIASLRARRGAVVARQAHNLEVTGSNPVAAIFASNDRYQTRTRKRSPGKLPWLRFFVPLQPHFIRPFPFGEATEKS